MQEQLQILDTDSVNASMANGVNAQCMCSAVLHCCTVLYLMLQGLCSGPQGAGMVIVLIYQPLLCK